MKHAKSIMLLILRNVKQLQRRHMMKILLNKQNIAKKAYADNPEKFKECSKNAYTNNPEKYKVASKKAYAIDPEKYKEASKKDLCK